MEFALGIVMGSDEAGYGPNLGPLVVTTTVWQIPDQLPVTELWQSLQPMVCRAAARGSNADAGRNQGCGAVHETAPFVVDDSKRVYSGGRSWRHLERSVLGFLGLLGDAPEQSPRSVGVPSQLSGLLRLLGVKDDQERASQPWLQEAALRLPRRVEAQELVRAVDQLRTHLHRRQVRLLAVHSEVVHPQSFNALLQSLGNKSTLLSQVSIDLLKRALLQSSSAQRVVAIADKHGGRRYYQELLQRAFPEYLVLCLHESRTHSRYRIRQGESQLEVSFQKQAEEHVPVALASMVCKYVRELVMEALNRFWTSRIDGLKPTAGYPADAKRFWRAIRPYCAPWGIPETVIWRER